RAPRGEGEAWALGAMLVAWPVGTLTASKLGGEVNSHLPLLLAGAVWALLRLPSTGALAEGPGRARAGAPALLALLLLLGTAHDGRRMWWIAFAAAHGDASRPAVAAALRDLPGRVVGPDDPALVLEGGHAPGGCLAMELDADGWSGRLPPSVARE